MLDDGSTKNLPTAANRGRFYSGGCYLSSGENSEGEQVRKGAKTKMLVSIPKEEQKYYDEHNSQPNIWHRS